MAIGNNFQSSLETTSLLSELGARFVVSRAATDVQEKFLLHNGADEVVYPEKQLAKWTAIRYSADHIHRTPCPPPDDGTSGRLGAASCETSCLRRNGPP